MPMSQEFKERLFPRIKEIAAHYGTPFHLYDEAGILATGAALKEAFAGIDGFREYYAVKALPNPRILALMKQMGFGFDCSSIPELVMSRQVGGRGEEIMFTSNNTSPEEFAGRGSRRRLHPQPRRHLADRQGTDVSRNWSASATTPGRAAPATSSSATRSKPSTASPTTR